MTGRAVIFVDGNNWYHGLRDHLQLPGLLRLDYAAISRKLLGSREWIATRYYIGRVAQQEHRELYASQRRFLARLIATDPRISYHLGRLEQRTVRNMAAEDLRKYLGRLNIRLPATVFRDLMQIARKHRASQIMVEKAVDVQIAVDIVMMAERDEYDVAYLLSADGDFTPAVTAARTMGKQVFAVAPLFGVQLAAATNAFIRLDRGWFSDCRLR